MLISISNQHFNYHKRYCVCVCVFFYSILFFLSFLCRVRERKREKERAHVVKTVITVSVNIAYSAVPQQLYSSFRPFSWIEWAHCYWKLLAIAPISVFVLLRLCYSFNSLGLALYVGQQSATSWHAFRVASSKQGSESSLGAAPIWTGLPTSTGLLSSTGLSRGTMVSAEHFSVMQTEHQVTLEVHVSAYFRSRSSQPPAMASQISFCFGEWRQRRASQQTIRPDRVISGRLDKRSAELELRCLSLRLSLRHGSYVHVRVLE